MKSLVYFIFSNCCRWEHKYYILNQGSYPKTDIKLKIYFYLFLIFCLWFSVIKECGAILKVYNMQMLHLLNKVNPIMAWTSELEVDRQIT